jgi:restriction endonuclease
MGGEMKKPRHMQNKALRLALIKKAKPKLSMRYGATNDDARDIVNPFF